MSYERNNIGRIEGYIPGEQPQSAALIKLNTNENPYPPSAGVLEAIRAVKSEQLRRYPPPRAEQFREVAGQTHGLDPDQVIATNGGDELLRMVITAFCQPQQSAPGTPGSPGSPGSPGLASGGVGISQPSYSLYPVLASIHDTPITAAPLGDDFALPDDFAKQLNDVGCRLGLVVNPHAPSGRLTSAKCLRQIAGEFRGVLVIDEAYVDFAEADALDLVRSGMPNVLILRTLSKGYSLAGLRFGYGLGHRDLIKTLDKVRDSYNTDILAQAGAVAALQARAEAMANCQKVKLERKRLSSELAQRGFKVYPSEANFILIKVSTTNLNAQNIYNALAKREIFVRYFDEDRLSDKLRITVGTKPQNDALLAGLDELI